MISMQTTEKNWQMKIIAYDRLHENPVGLSSTTPTMHMYVCYIHMHKNTHTNTM